MFVVAHWGFNGVFGPNAHSMLARCSPDHAVSTVHGGAEALKVLCDGNADFDIVLLDLCMPVVDGFEVAVRYRYIMCVISRIAHGSGILLIKYMGKPSKAIRLPSLLGEPIHRAHSTALCANGYGTCTTV